VTAKGPKHNMPYFGALALYYTEIRRANPYLGVSAPIQPCTTLHSV
jgi:hypothetical protein